MQGLSYVHSQNIIHCDIKTKNIFITKELTGLTKKKKIYFFTISIGVIGDFDVSQNDKTRITTIASKTQASVAGHTWDCMCFISFKIQLKFKFFYFVCYLNLNLNFFLIRYGSGNDDRQCNNAVGYVFIRFGYV